MSLASVESFMAFAQLSRIELDRNGLGDVLHHIAELARRAIPGAEEVSLTVASERATGTVAYTGERAVYLDERQYEQGDGPIVEAARTGDVVLVDDMVTEDRWPEYTARAAAAGIRSSLSVSVPMRDHARGVLSTYAQAPGTFDREAVALAKTFAEYAAVVLANAQTYAQVTEYAEQMQEAMRSRAVIEQAKGMIMARHGCTADQAFAILSRLSQHRNEKLRDIAQAMVTSVHNGREGRRGA